MSAPGTVEFFLPSFIGVSTEKKKTSLRPRVWLQTEYSHIPGIISGPRSHRWAPIKLLPFKSTINARRHPEKWLESKIKQKVDCPQGQSFSFWQRTFEQRPVFLVFIKSQRSEAVIQAIQKLNTNASIEDTLLGTGTLRHVADLTSFSPHAEPYRRTGRTRFRQMKMMPQYCYTVK